MIVPVLAAAVAASSPPAGASTPHLRAVHAEAPPSLDDEAWKAAPASTAFTQKFPNEGRAPSEPTTIRVLYDDRALWIGVDCVQEQAPIVAPLTRRDRAVETDSIAVALDTRGTGRDAFDFQIGAGGVLTDTLRFNDVDASTDWDENWDARVARTARGWSAEIWIPLRVLRFEAKDATSAADASWGFQARRYVSARQETDEWAFIPRDVAGEVSRYGRLDGIGALRPRGAIEVRPFVVGQLQRRDPGSDVAAAGFGARGSVGADLTWHVTPDLTLDGSFRPDFAQVEADQLVLNLTRFETFYPEKRPFFLEGREVFDTPAPILYTRRIGGPPASPSLRDGERLVDVPLPATIWGATKLVGSLGGGVTIGALTTIVGDATAEVQGAGGARERRVLAPLLLARVLRLKRTFGDLTIGTLLTAATRAEDGDAWPAVRDDDPSRRLCPDGSIVAAGRRCFHDAYVASVDARFRHGDYAATAQIAGSKIVEGPTRTLADGTTIGAGDAGAGWTAYVGKEGGKHLLWSLQWDGASRRLDFNDLGYMRRQAYQHLSGEIVARTLTPLGPFQEAFAFLDLFHQRNLDGLDLQTGAYGGAWARTPGYYKLYLAGYFEGRRLDDREIGDGAALERPWVLGGEGSITSDPRRAFAFRLHADVARLAVGWAVTSDATLTFRPTPALDLSLGPTAFWTRGEPRFVSALAGGAGEQSAYLLGALEAKNVAAVLRGTYTFTPRLTLQAYAQLFLASGHYDDFTRGVARGAHREVPIAGRAPASPPRDNPDFVDGALNVNLVLRWEFRLGSVLWLVLSRTQAPNVTLGPGEVGSLAFASVRRAPAVDVALLKLSFWFGG